MSQMDLGRDFDIEAQLEPVSSPVPPDSKTPIVRQLSCYLKLDIYSTHTSIEEGDIVAAGKPQSLARVSSSTATASAIVDSSEAPETARMPEMELGCETDLEAQSAPLLTTPDNMQRARQTLTKVIRIVQSIHRFKALLRNVSSDRSSSLARSRSERTAASAGIGSSAVKETDPETVEASVTTTTSGVDFTRAVLQSGHRYTGIGLQGLQRANISKIVSEKNLKDLNAIGGIKGVADALNTDLVKGIIPSERDQNDDHVIQTTSKNPPVPRNYFHFIWEASNNVTMYLLSAAAVLSLGFGIKEKGPNDGWSDGVIIILAIIVLVVFRATHRYWLKKAQQKSENREVRKGKEMKIHVVRGGCEEFTTGLVWGDIAILKKGYQVPADGLFIEGQNLKVDDGSKFVGNENPFLFHGVKVVNGHARMIVTAVGMETKWSKMMNEAASTLGEKLYLEAHLDKVTTCINITGLLITIIMFIVSFLRFVSGKLDSENGYKIDSKGEPTATTIILNTIEKILIQPKGSAGGLMTLLSVSLVGILDGIPFVISISIMYWNQKTLKGNVMVQDSRVCLKLASATTICTDTVGGLTKHEEEVQEFYVGKEAMCESSMISPEVLDKLCEGIGTFEIISESYFGCIMKEPLLSWAKERFGNRSQSTNLIKYQGESPEVEPCGTIIQVDGAQRRLHWKGPVIDIIKMCSHYYDSEGGKHSIDDERKLFETANIHMQERQMKTIAFACRSISPPELEKTEETNLTLVGLIGLKITIQEDTKKAIETCRSGGVRTILVSSDDVSELATLALQCGFHTPNSDEMLTGEDFRNFTPPERMTKLEKIQVLGNCDAADKQLLVKCLREKNEVVAVIARRSADAPALKKANIGLNAGMWSSIEARDMSDITAGEFDLISVVQMIKCGRCIHGNIQKFIQLELITNSACILINFIGVASLGDTPITSIQIFGLNLLVTFLGGLAILTEPPTNSLMNMPPVNPTKALVTAAMCRNIVTQTVYQVSVLVILQHSGPAILGISPEEKNSMIFNSFILCQFFNLFNARELQEKNFFTGICRNCWFWIALFSFMGFQAIFVKIDHTLMNGASLNWKLWTACSLMGIGSWLIDYAGKCGSVFVSIDRFKGCMTNLAGKYKSFLIIGSQADNKSMRTINTAPSECGSNLKHPLMSRNPSTIPLEIETQPIL